MVMASTKNIYAADRCTIQRNCLIHLAIVIQIVIIREKNGFFEVPI